MVPRSLLKTDAVGKVRVLYDYVATEKNALSLRAGELATLIEVRRSLCSCSVCKADLTALPLVNLLQQGLCLVHLLQHRELTAILGVLQNYEHGWCTVRMILTGKEGYFPGTSVRWLLV